MKVDISNGELVDKVSILDIKLGKIESENKRGNIRKEYKILSASMHRLGITEDAPEYRELKEVNLSLWETEDKIRMKESAGQFDEEFILLARKIYHENDRRSAIKRRINMATGSKIIEEKEYAAY